MRLATPDTVIDAGRVVPRCQARAGGLQCDSPEGHSGSHGASFYANEQPRPAQDGDRVMCSDCQRAVLRSDAAQLTDTQTKTRRWLCALCTHARAQKGPQGLGPFQVLSMPANALPRTPTAFEAGAAMAGGLASDAVKAGLTEHYIERAALACDRDEWRGVSTLMNGAHEQLRRIAEAAQKLTDAAPDNMINNAQAIGVHLRAAALHARAIEQRANLATAEHEIRTVGAFPPAASAKEHTK